MSLRSFINSRCTNPGSWLVALAALVAGIFVWWHAAGLGAAAGSDFHAYAVAATTVTQGGNPYHRLMSDQAGSTSFHANGYVYPPLLAVILAAPLHVGADIRLVWILWNLVTCIAVVYAAHTMREFLGDRTTSWAVTALIALLLLLPAVVTYDLWLGQADVFLMALVVIANGRWLHQRSGAAVILAFAIAIKPTLVILLLLWVWKRDWRATLICLASVVAFVGLPFVIVGPQALQDYLTFTLHWNGIQANAEFNNQSLYGMLLRLFTANPYTQPLVDAPWLVQPLRIGGLLLVLWNWCQAVPVARTANRGLAFSEFLLTLPLVVLLSPLAEDIHYVLIVPSLIGLSWLAWTHRLHHRRSAWLFWGVTIIAGLPRMQELIYPDRLVVFPWQSQPSIGWLIILFRSGILLWLGLLTFGAGKVLVTQARQQIASEESMLSPLTAPDMIVPQPQEDLATP